MGSIAEELKAKANEAFKEKKFQAADEYYTHAVEALEGQDQDDEEIKKALAIVLSNRAFTRLKLEEYGWAMADANCAVAANPKYIKGYYRRGSANFAIGKYQEALRDFKHVAKSSPGDKNAAAKLKECERIVRQEAFAKAIEADAPLSVLSSLDLDALQVDSSYHGPKFPEDKVTFEWVQELIAWFQQQKHLHNKYAFQLLIAAKAIFESLDTVETLMIDEGKEITVCGDTHGQFFDLMTIFKLNGQPSAANPYLFNGDFVDRGSWSVEVIMTLLAFKVADPQCMHLTRGNHESENMNKIYGFEGEVKAKHNERMYKLFAELFRAMPLAYVLDGSNARDGKRALVLHGGLFSRDGVKLEDLKKIDRIREPDSGLMAEMLWSDPQKENGWGVSKRGIGASFGPDVTKRFLEDNNLDLVVRSHEMKEEGYEIEADGKLITIFSAPNYCDQMGNKGAFIRFKSNMKPDIKQFTAVPHPNMKPMAYAANANLMGLT